LRPRSDLTRLRQDIANRLESAVRGLVGATPPDLKRYERAYRRHMVAESKAAYLYAGGRGAEALSLYESLVRERSLGEAEKQRLAHNVESLRAELAKR